MSIPDIYGRPSERGSAWQRHRVSLFVTGDADADGNTTIQFKVPFRSVYVERSERTCHIYAGTGRQFDLGEFPFGMRKTIHIPTEVDELFIEWGTTGNAEYRRPIPFGTIDPILEASTFTNPTLDIWTSSAIIYMEESYDPYAHIASVQPYTVWASAYQDINGDPIPSAAVRGNQRAFTNSYAVVFQEVARPYVSDLIMAANSRACAASFWKPQSSSRSARLRRVDIGLYSVSAATQLVWELKRIDTEPTGGVPRVAEPHNPVSSAAHTICRTKPSGGAGETGLALSSIYADAGITAAPSTVNPPPVMGWQNLYDDTFPDAMLPPHLIQNAAAGFGIFLDVNTAATIEYVARAWFTEH